jgi:hypothetical protein
MRRLRRFAVALWVVPFMIYTPEAARHPGLVFQTAGRSYPWDGVAYVWAVLALQAGVLHVILRPPTFRRSWLRWAGALAYGIVSLVAATLALPTDLPRHLYMPGFFAFVTVLGLMLMGLTMAVAAAVDRTRRTGRRAPAV